MGQIFMVLETGPKGYTIKTIYSAIVTCNGGESTMIMAFLSSVIVITGAICNLLSMEHFVLCTI